MSDAGQGVTFFDLGALTIRARDGGIRLRAGARVQLAGGGRFGVLANGPGALGGPASWRRSPPGRRSRPGA
jgi:hypothetical protein